MSEAAKPFDTAQHRQAWLKRLADEFLKLEAQMPVANFLPDDDGPAWAKKLEREIGVIIHPVAKLREALELTPERIGGILGHQCAMAVRVMEWFAEQKENPKAVEATALTPAPRPVT